MGIGNLGRLLNVGDQVFPGGCEPLVGLGFRPTLNQGFDNASDRHLLTAAIEDFLLELGDQSKRFVAELDSHLSHGKRQSLSH